MFAADKDNEIKKMILADLDEGEKADGTLINKLVCRISKQMCKLAEAMNSMVPVAFIDHTSGEYIDKRAEQISGIVRKSGTRAGTILEFTGDEGVVIKPEDSLFQTANGYQYRLEEDVLIRGGTGRGKASALEVGTRYNVPSGSVSVFEKAIDGVAGVTNIKDAAEGTDPEDDISLVERIYEYWRNPPTSGNVSHYMVWAKEVEGVGDARVIPIADGPGTVTVVIIDTERHPVTDGNTLTRCREFIDSMKPVGAKVTVKSAEPLNVKIKLVLKLYPGSDIDQIRNSIQEKIEQYITSIAFKSSELRYNQIAYLVLNTTGVKDYAMLEVNGSRSNVPLLDTEVAILQEVEVSTDAD